MFTINLNKLYDEMFREELRLELNVEQNHRTVSISAISVLKIWFTVDSKSEIIIFIIICVYKAFSYLFIFIFLKTTFSMDPIETYLGTHSSIYTLNL